MEKGRCFKGCLKGNKNKCHSKLDLESHRFLKRPQGEILNQVQDDDMDNNNCVRGRSQIKLGMTPNFNNSAFTLIELLVVVLIIGILAAVALPQYQVAVGKTRAMRLMSLMRAIQNAQYEYYLANGVYADDFEALSIDLAGAQLCNRVDGLPGNWFETKRCRKYEDFSCGLDSTTNWTSGSLVCGIKTPVLYITSPFGMPYWACWDDGDTTSLSARVCKSISGKANRGSNGSWVFIENRQQQ